MSFDSVVRVLDQTSVVAIVTTKADGQPIATPIWSMVVDGVPYVRSVNGAGAWWYRHVLAGRPVAFALSDGGRGRRDRVAALARPRARVATTYGPVADGIQARVGEELRREYAGQASSVGAMLSPDARGCTLRIEEAR